MSANDSTSQTDLNRRAREVGLELLDEISSMMKSKNSGWITGTRELSLAYGLLAGSVTSYSSSK